MFVSNNVVELYAPNVGIDGFLEDFITLSNSNLSFGRRLRVVDGLSNDASLQISHEHWFEQLSL